MLQDDYLQNIGPQINSLHFNCSVIAGGSYSYKYSLFHSLGEVRDIDLLVFFPTREEITDFLTIHQQDLDKILHLEEVEKHFCREDLIPLTNSYADAIRYSGQNDLGQKISVKIIAYDQLIKASTTPQPVRINVLSKKDKRYYSHKTLSGQSVSFGIVNQECGNDLCILGDPSFLATGSDYCLGVISDVCLSGKIIYNSKELDVQNIKSALVNKIVNICEANGYPKKWSDILARSDRLPLEFAKEFCNQFPAIPSNKVISPPKNIKRYSVQIVSPIVGGSFTQIKLKRKIQSTIKEKRYLNTSGPFSSNSKYGMAIYATGEKAFFKEMLNESRFKGEIFGLITASAYFNKLRIPIFTDPDKLLISYDWFPGDILARQRLDEINDVVFSRIMDLELHRAEDHLNAYIKSYEYSLNKGASLYKSRINDLFYNRLIGSRFSDYYANTTIIIDSQPVTFESILNLPIFINGHSFPSIFEIIANAKQYLDPQYLETKEIVCGLGDAHSGNIICSSNLHDYAYVDYEFAGFHSPYLDLAKQLYNDTAFNLFYSDILPQESRQISAKIINGVLHINHNYSPDLLSQYLYTTKMEGILLPFLKYCHDHHSIFDNSWKSILGSALFCCGFLTRNLSTFDSDNFMLNLANSIESTNINHYSKKFGVNL